MTDVKIGGKTYSLGYTMLSVVRSKALTGRGFFSLAAQEQIGSEDGQIDPEAAMEKVFYLLLLGLQTNHSDEFKSIEDVARAFPDMASITAVTPAINTELQRFLAVDPSLQRRAQGERGTTATGAKKKSRSTPSPKTSTAQNAESTSV